MCPDKSYVTVGINAFMKSGSDFRNFLVRLSFISSKVNKNSIVEMNELTKFVNIIEFIKSYRENRQTISIGNL